MKTSTPPNFYDEKMAHYGGLQLARGFINENVANLHIKLFSLPSPAKQQREITKFEVLWRTSANLVPRALFPGFGGGKSALGTKLDVSTLRYIIIFSPKLSVTYIGFILEGLPWDCPHNLY